MSTVDLSSTSTVDSLSVTADDLGGQPGDMSTDAGNDMNTVDGLDQSTVVEMDMSIVGGSKSSITINTAAEPALKHEISDQGGEEHLDKPEFESSAPPYDTEFRTVGISGISTVSSSEIPPKKTPEHVVLWITEQGDLVPQARVKRIRLAQDVINSAEESVYDTLWTAKSNQTDDREPSRVVQAGYDYLVKRTRLSKKTIQRIVAKLIDKDFIAIERPADIYQRTSTVYRVFSYKAVLDRHQQRGRSHVAKMGPGFSYVRPIEDPRLAVVNSVQPRSTGPSARNLSTVDTSSTPTVVNKLLATRANRTTDTVDESDPSTVVRGTTTYIGTDPVDSNTSSSAAIYQALSHYGAVDDDILDRLIRTCKQQAPDCTEEEIIHFIHEKGSLVRVKDTRIYSPIGFLVTAVPKCLCGEAFRLYREEQMKRREADAACEARRQAELDEWRREQEARLADPNVPEHDKQFIREWLGVH